MHVKNGVCPGWGGGARLVQLLGGSRALELLASGRLVGADEALALGLANAKVADQSEALEWIRARALGAREVLGALKCMVRGARSQPLEVALAGERQLFAATWGREAHLAALDANTKHSDGNNKR